MARDEPTVELENLRHQLLELDGRGYKAYKDIQGRYDGSEFTLIIDYVQGDPFASPSKCRVLLPQSVAGFPRSLYRSRSREIALRDYLTRQFSLWCDRISDRRGTGKSGLIATCRMGQEVLERTSAFVNHREVELRFVVGLPARGRRILGRQAAQMLCEDIPQSVDRALYYDNLDAGEIERHVETVEDADWLRDRLSERGLVAFVADRSILPRQSGVDPRPLQDRAVPFESPPSLRVEFDCPNRGKISGMGIPTGVTPIVGGGYHGKSTLLSAIELGIYNRIPGDAREVVVTQPDAVKIRAEDGRQIAGVDISLFINNLPQGRSTTQFSTANASGSTSQAANIVEALEMDAKVLLVDEDTAATNFMIRDRRMQALIAKEKEPITPFIDRVRQLSSYCGISTVLVMGGSGDYFDVADTVIGMEDFRPRELTREAKAIARQYATGRREEGSEDLGEMTERIPLPESLDPSRGKRLVKWQARDVDAIAFGTEDIDLSAVEQLVDVAQLRGIAEAMVYAKQHYIDGRRSLRDIIDAVMDDIETGGLSEIAAFPQGDLAMFRRFELAAAIDRLRTLQITSNPS
ncbi:ABC-ATPase domain-containing protein [Oscillatoriales cyanobacterium LEGE 11467]|uniref:ABC-ATPase domain-containing protein n=1 Tax=Zarconia navalis LEGE 11467 TaxID=1828826 RepID=A0A928VYP8_9CYAN|nr:ABC-ATPase domain-containing protein [Zarconia navalis]MBE9041718.1 ABC-ATPase domain-containing protein [Zarconia navalis LEGE 11467]